MLLCVRHRATSYGGGKSQNEDVKWVIDAPQTTEERTTRRMLKGFLYCCLETPVCGPPYSNGAVIGLGREKLAHRVPANTLYESLVQIEFDNAIQGVTAPDHDLRIKSGRSEETVLRGPGEIRYICMEDEK